MTDTIIEFFRNIINNDFITVVIISMIPLIELRGSIPVAIAMGLNPLAAFACAWAGSIIIAPILLLILQPILALMKKCKPFRTLAQGVESIFQGKASIVESKAGQETDLKKAERKKLFGVFAFVALPIPLTGVWTGSAVASFLGLGFWKSFLMVTLGNFVAGGIITLLSVFLEAYIDIILYALFAIVIVALIFYIVKLVLHMKKAKAENLQMEQDSIGNAEASKNEEHKENVVVNVENNDNKNGDLEQKEVKLDGEDSEEKVELENKLDKE